MRGYVQQRADMFAYWLWTSAEVKMLSELEFKFWAKLKSRIKLLSSRHNASRANRKILDEIYLEVAAVHARGVGLHPAKEGVAHDGPLSC